MTEKTIRVNAPPSLVLILIGAVLMGTECDNLKNKSRRLSALFQKLLDF